MNDDSSEPDPIVRLESSADKVLSFSSVLPAHPSPIPLRCWVSIPNSELQAEVIRRNGPFQLMLGFMRELFHAAVVVDASGRVIFINRAMEIYWRVNLWDVQGRQFAEVMQLDEPAAERNANRRREATSGRYPDAFLEGFHSRPHWISMYWFPFADASGDLLLGAFILPHPPIKRIST